MTLARHASSAHRSSTSAVLTASLTSFVCVRSVGPESKFCVPLVDVDEIECNPDDGVLGLWLTPSAAAKLKSEQGFALAGFYEPDRPRNDPRSGVYLLLEVSREECLVRARHGGGCVARGPGVCLV